MLAGWVGTPENIFEETAPYGYGSVEMRSVSVQRGRYLKVTALPVLMLCFAASIISTTCTLISSETNPSGA